jgi:hypothetical protein
MQHAAQVLTGCIDTDKKVNGSLSPVLKTELNANGNE